VQSDELVADKVVAGRNALRDCVGDGATCLHEGSRTPGVGGTGAAVLLDLKPDSAVFLLVHHLSMIMELC
jgi:hypothetical protein